MNFVRNQKWQSALASWNLLEKVAIIPKKI
jgi:hypothetical protein